MRDLCTIILAIGIFVLAIGHCLQEARIQNMEQTMVRMEQGYNAVLAENEKLVRMNNQTLHLIVDSSWFEREDKDDIHIP